MHNSRHDVSFPADDDMSSSLRCVWTALPASTVGRWTEGLSLCHWHSCHLIQVQWVFEQIHCHSLWWDLDWLDTSFYVLKTVQCTVCFESRWNHLDRWFPLNVTCITWTSFMCWFATTSSVQISWSPVWIPSIQWHLIWQIWFNIQKIEIHTKSIDLTATTSYKYIIYRSYQHLSFTTRGSLPWQVTTLVDFLDFLQAKHPSIRKVGRWVVGSGDVSRVQVRKL